MGKKRSYPWWAKSKKEYNNTMKVALFPIVFPLALLLPKPKRRRRKKRLFQYHT